MNNYKLIIQYDGTNYAGWQIQAENKSVQQTITNAIKTVTGEDVDLIGSGRTDAGVHALGQVANFKAESDLDVSKFKYSLNSVFPKDISIVEFEKVSEDFHARYSAISRKYLYLFIKYKSPFYERFAYRYFYNLNCSYLNDLSKSLVGKKDFTSFAKKSSEIVDKNCTVYEAHWSERKGFVLFFVEANRFLHGMVRTIVGTLLNAQKNNYDGKYIEKVLSTKNREIAAESVPAKGLFLYKVKY